MNDLPLQYIFQLSCCYKSSCTHPFCTLDIHKELKWYNGGPATSYLPDPIPDPTRPWGSNDCPECPGETCYGHFMMPDQALLSTLPVVKKPPSAIIREVFERHKDCPLTEDEITSTSKDVLLSPNEVKMWLAHLQTVKNNRKRGAKKAALTRQKKRTKEADTVPESNEETIYYCGVCHHQKLQKGTLQLAS